MTDFSQQIILTATCNPLQAQMNTTTLLPDEGCHRALETLLNKISPAKSLLTCLMLFKYDGMLRYCMTAAALAHMLTHNRGILATIYEDLHCFCVSTLLSAMLDLQCR